MYAGWRRFRAILDGFLPEFKQARAVDTKVADTYVAESKWTRHGGHRNKCSNHGRRTGRSGLQ